MADDNFVVNKFKALDPLSRWVAVGAAVGAILLLPAGLHYAGMFAQAKSPLAATQEGKPILKPEVLERCLVGMLGMAEQLQLDCLPPDAALVKLLTTMLHCMSENPHVGSILCLEAIQNKGKYYPKQLGNILYGTVVEILEQGINLGVFRQLDPRHTAVNIVGACSFYFTAQENLKYLWPGKRLLGKELLQGHTQESIDLIMAGVRNL